jgi:reverse gyrase
MLNQAKLLKQELKKIKKRDLKQRVKVALLHKKLKKRGRKPKSESLKQDQQLKISADAFINKASMPASSAYSNSVSQLDCY